MPCHLVPVLLEAVLHLLLFVPNGVFMKMVFKQFLEVVRGNEIVGDARVTSLARNFEPDLVLIANRANIYLLPKLFVSVVILLEVRALWRSDMR